MDWKELKLNDKVIFSISDLGKKISYIGYVEKKFDDHIIIRSDLLIIPKDKRLFDISEYVDDDTADCICDIKLLTEEQYNYM